MSTKKREQYENLLSNPNVRKALDIISASENADYNTTFGGGTFDGYSKHPNIQKKFKQKNGQWNSSGAAGRYQMLKSTWDELQSTYGLDDFSPRNQDLGAIALLDRLKGKDGKTALQSALEGNFQSMVEKAGKTWASFPSAPAAYSQPKHGWNKMNKIIASATGTPVPSGEDNVTDSSTTQSSNYDMQRRYNSGVSGNPVDMIYDGDYRNLQGELFDFNDNNGKPESDRRDRFIPEDQVASVQQTPFIDIPAIYDKAIEDTFGDGYGQNELFPKDIEDSLRGVFDAA